MARAGGVLTAFLAAGLAVMLAACGMGSDPTPDYRYRLTVEVETPQGRKTGSSVIEVQQRLVRPGSNPAGQAVRFSLRGEAVAVDLGEDRTLFALLRSDSDVEWASRVMLQLLPRLANASWEERFDDMMALEGKGAIEVPRSWPKKGFLDERSAYPMLVTFGDLADPTSVAEVDPDDLAATFGEGVSLKRITVQMTDDPVTTGIEQRLGWLGQIKSMGVKRSDFPDDVPVGAFSEMFRKGF